MEIINSIEIMESAGASGFAVIVSLIGAILLGFGVGSCMDLRCREICDFNGPGCIVVVSSLIIGWLILLCGSVMMHKDTNTEVPTGRYRYECIVDEDYSLLELTERYNIIDHEGNRYILEDKEG